MRRTGDRRGELRILMGRPEGRRLLERRKRIWEDDIKMDLHDVGWGGIDWIDLGQDRDRRWVLVNTYLLHGAESFLRS